MLRRIFTLLLFIAFANCAFAFELSVEICAFSKETNQKLVGAKVDVYVGRDVILTEYTDHNGATEFTVTIGETYKITADYEGKVGKNLILDTKTVPANKHELLSKRQTFSAHFYLFDQGDLRYTHLEHPMGRFKYNKRKRMMLHDKAYTRRRKHSNDILRKKS